MKRRSLHRLIKSSKIRYGSLQIKGAPAIVVSLTGLVLASTLLRIVVQRADRLPETIREARALADAARSSRGSYRAEISDAWQAPAR